MLVFKTPLVLCVVCVMLALHIISYFTSDVISKILTYVNIALHIVLVYPLIHYGFTIDESVLLYMISTFVFVTARFIGARFGRGGDVDDV